MSEAIILLSSDDETEEPPLKKIKNESLGSAILRNLNRLKELPSAKYNVHRKETVIKQRINDSRFTIIIESATKPVINQDEVITLIDVDEKDAIKAVTNGNSDCLILATDSEPEDKAPLPNGSNKSPEPIVESTTATVTNENKNGTDFPSSTALLDTPSTSSSSDSQKQFDEFLETCTNSLRGTKYETKVSAKIPKLKDMFQQCSQIHNDPAVSKLLRHYLESAKLSAPEAVISFQRVFSYFLENINADCVEVEEEHVKMLKKLELTCKKLLKKIHRLEKMEVNFEDDDDSSYIMLDRYSQRLSKVYNKYCEILKRNPHTGRLLYGKLRFSGSKYNEINRAISKSYKHNKFPSYYDIEKSIRNSNNKNNLNLNDMEIKEESKHCFTKLGNLLQMRRKKELEELHSDLVNDEEPVIEDDDLKTKLQENAEEGEKKLKEVIEKFVKLQEQEIQVDISEDSDDSNYKDSDSEGDK